MLLKQQHIGVLMSMTVLAMAPYAWSAERDEWEFDITPYLFAAGMDGKIGVRGVTSDVELSFGDILDDLDQAFMGLVEARKGPWSYGLDAIYIKLDSEGSKTVSGPFGRVSADGAVEITSKVYVYQGSIGYRVLEGDTQVDLLGALRYTDIDVDADVEIATTPGIVFPGGARRASGSESWTDGVAGVRVQHQLSRTTALLGYADVGAGGSDLSYQLLAGINWTFAEGVAAKLGYRQLGWDYDNDGFVWDLATGGPYLGVGFTF